MELLLKTKALADETRLRLLGVLARYELNVGEIVQVMNMGQSRISRHLKILVDAGLLTCRRQGMWSFYSAGRIESALLRAVLDDLEHFDGHQADLAAAQQVLNERRRSTTHFFDEIAADWNRLSREMLGEFDLVQAIERCIAADNPGTVVDLGCGPGFLLERLSQTAELVIGVDNSSRMLEAAGKRLADGPEVSLRIGDLEHLPLRDAEADAAIMSLVLHHLAAPQDGIMEAGRVVRPGGLLVLADFLPHTNEILRTRYGDRQLGLAPDDLAVWLGQAGFRIFERTTHEVNLGLVLLILTARREESAT